MKNCVEIHHIEEGNQKGTYAARVWVQGRIIAQSEGYVNYWDAQDWGGHVMDALWGYGYRPTLSKKWYQFWK